MRTPSIPITAAWGVRLAFAAAAISGVAVWLNASALRAVGDPVIYTTMKNLIAALVLIVAAVAMGHAREVRHLDRGQWARLLVIGLVGGSLPFLLFFTGLSMATAPTAAFIHKTLFLWVAVLAVPLLGERVGAVQVAALGVLVLGQMLLLNPFAGDGFGTAEILIAAATLLWAVEVIIAKRVLGDVSPSVVGSARLGFGLIVLVGYVVIDGRAAALLALPPESVAWVVLTGIVLAGYVGTWLAALRRAAATVVTAVLVVGALVTALLTAVSDGRVPEGTALLGLIALGGAGLAMAMSAGRMAPSGDRPAASARLHQ